MQSLRSEVKALRHQVAGDSKYFIPRQSLIDLLSYDKIRSALQVSEVVSLERLDSLAVRILSGAQRVFAILVVLGGCEKEILRFVEHDNLQGLPIDHRLPFSKSELKELLPHIWDDFYEKQWEFSAPVFLEDTEHRFLHDFTILPFVNDQKIAEGGFGEVFRIGLHPGHQQASWLGRSSSFDFVRKQFSEKTDDSLDAGSHRKELENFALLAHLKHPHIQQLLASFTYHKKHNFIFPLARGGDMKALLRTSPRPVEFIDDSTCYMALAGLCSALESMHGFAIAQRLDIQVLGLHRDIQPSNILVSEANFILTDFGLSTFKTRAETSRTPFQVGGGDYLPPECEDLDTFEKGIVGRSGDIWSLGCVMLEFLVYMDEGPSGVANFERERVFQATWKMRTFHGPGKEVNPRVIKLMEKLRKSYSLPTQNLVGLVTDMLSMVPEARPRAQEVTTRVQFAALSSLMVSLNESYANMVRITNSSQALVEHEKLKSWMYVSSLIDSHRRPPHLVAEHFSSRFKRVIELIRNNHEEVDRICERFVATGRAMFYDLRRINEALFDILPVEVRTQAVAYLDLRLLGNENLLPQDLDALSQLSPSIIERLGTLAYAKRFSEGISTRLDAQSLEATTDHVSSIRLIPKDVHLEHAFEEHDIGWIGSKEEVDRQKVLIEWIRYDLHWEGHIEHEMVQRVTKIAVSLRKMKSQAETLRILPCSHYFHSITHHAFGLLYDLPLKGKCDSPRSLHSIIIDTRRSGFDQVSYEDRLTLARVLASTLLDFHKATLVHKSISSYNIIFTSREPESIRDPYLIGFNYARPLQPKAFTTGPPPSRNAQMYFHPEYDSQNVRDDQEFQLRFDYYSLGLVLLEIGIWDVVANVKAKSRGDLKKKLLDNRVPLLKHCMGTAYYEAVDVCLRDRRKVGPLINDTDTILEFQRSVVGALQRCPAIP